MRKRIAAAVLSLLICAQLAACAGSDSGSAVNETVTDAAVPSMTETAVTADKDMFSDRDHDASYSNCITIDLSSGTASSSSGIKFADKSVTIAREGTYLLTGKTADGRVIINADDADKIHLILDGADITASEGAAVNIVCADKVFITLADGSENFIASTGAFSVDDNVDAAVFSKSDLTFNGNGKLKVSSAQGHGIVSKDDLKFTGGVYTVNAAKKGLSANDRFCADNGVFDITSGTDGIDSENKDDASLGIVYIAGGSFNINSDGDCISAGGDVTVIDGQFTMTSGGGNENGAVKNDFGFRGAAAETTSAETISAKGIKSAASIIVGGGSFAMNTADDAVHSGKDILISGGSFDISSGDDGIHADSQLNISNGAVNISKSYEGIEATVINVSGGAVSVAASDDGFNAAGGNDGSSVNGRMGQNPFDTQADAAINISGGSINVNAKGDGIDSNGSIDITGGDIRVSGPENSGNGSLDYGISAVISSGSFIAASAKGMNENFSKDTVQCSILCDFASAKESGTAVIIKDSDSNVIAEFTPENKFQSILVSDADIKADGIYTVSSGDETIEIAMNGNTYGSGMGMGGFGGGKGRDFGGKSPENFAADGSFPQMPEGAEMERRPKDDMMPPEMPEGAPMPPEMSETTVSQTQALT